MNSIRISNKLNLHFHRLNAFNIYINTTTKRFCQSSTDEVVIVAAVRTPWINYRESLYSVSPKELASSVVNTVIKQAAIDIRYFKSIYVAKLLSEPTNDDAVTEQDLLGTLTKNIEYISLEGKEGSDLNALLKALENLRLNQNKAVIIGSILETSLFNASEEYKLELQENLLKYGIAAEDHENFLKRNKEKFLQAKQNHLFDGEVMAMEIKQKCNKRLNRKLLERDELDEEVNSLSKIGACALIMTTKALALKLHIKPLAAITHLSYKKYTRPYNIAENFGSLLHNDINVMNIRHWEAEDTYNIMPIILSKYWNIKSDLINPQGGVKLLSGCYNTSLPHLLIHLIHSLKANEQGCTISSNAVQFAAVLIEKLYHPTSDNMLTLYTKKSCPLCDRMLEELESHFSGLYKLEKVFIDCEEDVRFLHLYRYDVPVLFLNGQFLCMHRLNVPLLRRKLQLLKEK